MGHSGYKGVRAAVGWTVDASLRRRFVDVRRVSTVEKIREPCSKKAYSNGGLIYCKVTYRL